MTDYGLTTNDRRRWTATNRYHRWSTTHQLLVLTVSGRRGRNRPSSPRVLGWWTNIIVSALLLLVVFPGKSRNHYHNPIVININVEASPVGYSNNYNVYNYDRTVMQFTPDGRLLQIGYASSAVDNSPPLVVVECFDIEEDADNNEDVTASLCNVHDGNKAEEGFGSRKGRTTDHKKCLILMTVPRPDPGHNNKHEEKREQQEQQKSTSSSSSWSSRSKRRPQNRIVILDDGRSSIGSSNSCCICLSGVLADSLALLKKTLEEWDEGQSIITTAMGTTTSINGGDDEDSNNSVDIVEPVSWWKFLQSLANECHVNSLGGGIRPYGSCFVVCGYKQDYYEVEEYSALNDKSNDDDDDDTSNEKLKIAEDEPSGRPFENRRRRSKRRRVHQRTSSFVYQTDPSGGIIVHSPSRNVDDEILRRRRSQKQQWQSSSSSSSSSDKPKKHLPRSVKQSSVTSLVRCIIGGSSTQQRQLHQSINEELQRIDGEQQQTDLHDEENNYDNPPTVSLAHRIATIGRVLIEERNGGDTSTMLKRDLEQETKKNEKISVNVLGDNDDGSGKNSQLSRERYVLPPLEVVIVSPHLGSYRLNDRQLRNIEDLIISQLTTKKVGYGQWSSPI
jgi:hypothetical protein